MPLSAVPKREAQRVELALLRRPRCENSRGREARLNAKRAEDP